MEELYGFMEWTGQLYQVSHQHRTTYTQVNFEEKHEFRNNCVRTHAAGYLWTNDWQQCDDKIWHRKRYSTMTSSVTYLGLVCKYVHFPLQAR